MIAPVPTPAGTPAKKMPVAPKTTQFNNTPESAPVPVSTPAFQSAPVIVPNVPADGDRADREIAAILDRTQRSPAVEPLERVKFLKLAWDALGSEFASRHVQYEMFYAGAQFVTRGHSFRTYDWARATGMVDRLMSGYGLEA